MRKVNVVLLLLALVLASCGGGSGGAEVSGDASKGKELFAQPTIGASKTAGCVICHSVEPGKTVVGPSLAGVAGRAAGALKATGYQGTAKTDAEWLSESIVSPDLSVAAGFTGGLMPSNYAKELTTEQVEDLVAYLLTLK